MSGGRVSARTRGVLPFPNRGDQPEVSGPATAAVRRVAVVIPARDEAATLGSCLRRVTKAAERLARDLPLVEAQLIVVAVRCTDETAAVASEHGAWVLHSESGRVGSARHLGASAALGAAARRGIPPERCWLANTDADSSVPSSWLVRQVEMADLGYDGLVGTVIPTRLPRPLLDAWLARHTLGDDHPHVHGANLGIRGSAYQRLGGFAPIAVHEDADLVARLKASGMPWRATDDFRVATSSRLVGRAPHGFAAYLSALVEHAPIPVPVLNAEPETPDPVAS